jgi:hypothetical protein
MNVAKISDVPTKGIKRQDQIVFSTFRTQFTMIPHRQVVAEQYVYCLAKH